MAEQEQQEAMVRIDGTDYKVSDLSEEARAQVQSLRFVEAELQRLNAQIAVCNTAKNAYMRALKEVMPSKS
jgi:hypothetical protein